MKKDNILQLRTDRNKSGWIVTQSFIKGSHAEIVESFHTSKDFKRLQMGVPFGSPYWFSVSLAEIKNGRMYERSMEIDKQQLEQLIENLKALNELITY